MAKPFARYDSRPEVDLAPTRQIGERMFATLGVPDSTRDVVGVGRVGRADALRAHGADIVVRDLAELLGRT